MISRLIFKSVPRYSMSIIFEFGSHMGSAMDSLVPYLSVLGRA